MSTKRPARAGRKPAAKPKKPARKPAPRTKRAAEAFGNPARRPARGRPSAYSDELADSICARLAEGQTLSSICKADDMPGERTVRSWALDPGHPFSTKYARAREVGYHKMADELLDIADETAESSQDAARNRLRVDTRKWLLPKALPKIYGDRVDLEHSRNLVIDEPEMSNLDLARRIAFVFGEAMQLKQQQAGQEQIVVDGPWPALVRGRD